jgi:hypothetical protein
VNSLRQILALLGIGREQQLPRLADVLRPLKAVS